MKHGSLHTRSTLLQSTGNIERERVRAEIKEFVKHDTERVMEEVQQHNAQFRVAVKKHHDELVALYEDNRKKQMNRWRLRTMNSPLRLDQNEIQRKLHEDWQNYFKKERKHKQIKEELYKMTGKPVFDICSDEYLRKIEDPEKKLAMERRKLLRELSVVKKESRKLHSMVDKSMTDAERMFPQVALQIAYGHSTSGQSIGSSLISKQRITGEEALAIKNQDHRVYSAAGRYDELGRFVPVDQLKTKAQLVSAEYAQVAGNAGVTNEFQMMNSYALQKQLSVSGGGSLSRSVSSTGSSMSPTNRSGSMSENRRQGSFGGSSGSPKRSPSMGGMASQPNQQARDGPVSGSQLDNNSLNTSSVGSLTIHTEPSFRLETR